MSSPDQPVPPAPLSDEELAQVRAWLADFEKVPEPEFIAGRPLSRLLATVADRDKQIAELKGKIHE